MRAQWLVTMIIAQNQGKGEREVCAPAAKNTGGWRRAPGPCRPAALPEGVLAARRGELLFLQNCRSMPVLLPSGYELPGYGTAVYRAGGERLL